MRGLFYRALRTIEYALSARREYMTKDGQIIYGGPATTRGSPRRSTSAIFWGQVDRSKQPEAEAAAHDASGTRGDAEGE